MIIVITRDLFLLEAIKKLLPDEEVFQANENTNIFLTHSRGLRIVIDSFYNNILHTPFIQRLAFLFPEQIIILSAFNVRYLLMGIDVIYVNRKIGISPFTDIFKKKTHPRTSLIKISAREHFVLTQMMGGKSLYEISQKMNISVKTIRSYIHQIKKILRVTRIHHIAQMNEFKYLIAQVGKDSD